jgi:hypothetical protein
MDQHVVDPFGNQRKRPRSDIPDCGLRELSESEITKQFSELPNCFPAGATYPQMVAAQFPACNFQLNNAFTNTIGPSVMLSVNGSSGYFTNDY